MRRLVDSGMFPGTLSSYSVTSFEELLFLPGGTGRLGQPVAKIPALLIPSSHAKILVLYAHGNGSDLGDIYDLMRDLSRLLPATVIAFDYPGYGKHTGRADESSVDRCLWTVLTYVSRELRIPFSRILLWGVSIGTGPVTRAAATLATKMNERVGGLVLQCPYRSIPDAARSFIGSLAHVLVSHRWNVQQEVLKSSCPVLWIHGQQDELFDWKGSLEMYNQYKGVFGNWAQCHFPHSVNHTEFNLLRDLVHPVRAFVAGQVLTRRGEIRLAEVSLITKDVAPYRPTVEDFWNLKEVNIRTSPTQKYMSLRGWIRGEVTLGLDSDNTSSGESDSDLDHEQRQYRSHRCANLLENFSSSENVSRHVYQRYLQFLLQMRDDALERALFSKFTDPFFEVQQWVRRYYYLWQPTLFVDVVYANTSSTSTAASSTSPASSPLSSPTFSSSSSTSSSSWALLYLVVGGIALQLKPEPPSHQQGVKGRLFVSRVPPNKPLLAAFPAPHYLVLPLFVPPTPPLQPTSEWLLSSLLNPCSLSSKEGEDFLAEAEKLAEHFSVEMIAKLVPMKQRPVFEVLTPRLGGWMPFGWDFLFAKLFGEHANSFYPRIQLHEASLCSPGLPRLFDAACRSYSFHFPLVHLSQGSGQGTSLSASPMNEPAGGSGSSRSDGAAPITLLRGACVLAQIPQIALVAGETPGSWCATPPGHLLPPSAAAAVNFIRSGPRGGARRRGSLSVWRAHSPVGRLSRRSSTVDCPLSKSDCALTGPAQGNTNYRRHHRRQHSLRDEGGRSHSHQRASSAFAVPPPPIPPIVSDNCSPQKRRLVSGPAMLHAPAMSGHTSERVGSFSDASDDSQETWKTMDPLKFVQTYVKYYAPSLRVKSELFCNVPEMIKSRHTISGVGCILGGETKTMADGGGVSTGFTQRGAGGGRALKGAKGSSRPLRMPLTPVPSGAPPGVLDMLGDGRRPSCSSLSGADDKQLPLGPASQLKPVVNVMAEPPREGDSPQSSSRHGPRNNDTPVVHIIPATMFSASSTTRTEITNTSDSSLLSSSSSSFSTLASCTSANAVAEMQKGTAVKRELIVRSPSDCPTAYRSGGEATRRRDSPVLSRTLSSSDGVEGWTTPPQQDTPNIDRSLRAAYATEKQSDDGRPYMAYSKFSSLPNTEETDLRLRNLMSRASLCLASNSTDSIGSSDYERSGSSCLLSRLEPSPLTEESLRHHAPANLGDPSCIASGPAAAVCRTKQTATPSTAPLTSFVFPEGGPSGHHDDPLKLRTAPNQPDEEETLLANHALCMAYIRLCMTMPDGDLFAELAWLHKSGTKLSGWKTAVSPFESHNPLVRSLEDLLSYFCEWLEDYDGARSALSPTALHVHGSPPGSLTAGVETAARKLGIGVTANAARTLSAPLSTFAPQRGAQPSRVAHGFRPGGLQLPPTPVTPVAAPSNSAMNPNARLAYPSPVITPRDLHLHPHPAVAAASRPTSTGTTSALLNSRAAFSRLLFQHPLLPPASQSAGYGAAVTYAERGLSSAGSILGAPYTPPNVRRPPTGSAEPALPAQQSMTPSATGSATGVCYRHHTLTGNQHAPQKPQAFPRHEYPPTSPGYCFPASEAAHLFRTGRLPHMMRPYVNFPPCASPRRPGGDTGLIVIPQTRPARYRPAVFPVPATSGLANTDALNFMLSDDSSISSDSDDDARSP